MINTHYSQTRKHRSVEDATNVETRLGRDEGRDERGDEGGDERGDELILLVI